MLRLLLRSVVAGLFICLAYAGGAASAADVSAASGSTVGGQARVIDGDTLAIDDQVIRLLDIDAPELAQTCTGGPKPIRACGKAAAEALAAKIGSGVVNCLVESEDDYGRLLARCSMGEVDLSVWSVTSGWSLAFVRYSDRLADEEQQARDKRIGIWAAKDVQAPWDYRKARWEVAAQKAPDGCPIKGNISSSGERIYHVPWAGNFYDRTKISTKKGERWFCSEAEAVEAGWRASYR